MKESDDPLRDSHLFLLAKPARGIPKRSESKAKSAQPDYTEPVELAKSHAMVFDRLGMDLLNVSSRGEALVHVETKDADKLIHSASMLDQSGLREQARWAPLSSFDLIPAPLRLDMDWFATLKRKDAADTIIELQAVLSEQESEVVFRAIVTTIRPALAERFVGAGTDFSGRRWARGRFSPETLQSIANRFHSVQSLHAPIYSVAAGKGKVVIGVAPAAAQSPDPNIIQRMPTVAVVDTGIPEDHAVLRQYRRGTYRSPDGPGRPIGHHGSYVASRAVFGAQEFWAGIGSPKNPKCRFYDINIAELDNDIHDKNVIPAIDAVIGTSPDVRVFNLSFGAKLPFAALSDVSKQAGLAMLRDLDNLVFARDIAIVIAAGNTASGVAPTSPYPGHIDDPGWGLGYWAMSFNAMACGAYVGRVHPSGLAAGVGYPSPFTRLGPGLCESPVPTFGAPGGNTDKNYRWAGGMGEWCCNSEGRWEDVQGTSFAAPLLAREAAIAFDFLQQQCDSGARPFACLVRAFLTLTARRPQVPDHILAIADRAVGHGLASSNRLWQPIRDTATILWQGVLPNNAEKVRVQLPIPRTWLAAATSPKMRVVVAWDSPVNDAARDLWACRKIDAHLRVSPADDAKALHGSRDSHKCFPLLDRTYDLTRLPKDESPSQDLWLLELSYHEIAPYFPFATFSPEQRVGLAAELYDDDPTPESPQLALQSLPSAATMNRLSSAMTASRVPLILRTRR